MIEIQWWHLIIFLLTVFTAIGVVGFVACEVENWLSGRKFFS